MLREDIFNIVTEPPCHYNEMHIGRKVCDFWDIQGHYCFLKDLRQDIQKCALLSQILSLKINGITLRELEEYGDRVAILPTKTNIITNIGFKALEKKKKKYRRLYTGRYYNEA